MKNILSAFIFFVFVATNLYSYESEDQLEVVVIGKVSKFVKWERDRKSSFIITVLDNDYGDLFDKTYKGKKIQNRPIELKYINSIEELKFTHVLYIGHSNSSKLQKIMKKIKNKNILVISKIRGFAQKGGVIQIAFVSRKPKLTVNITTAKSNKLKVSSSLLKISEIVKDK